MDAFQAVRHYPKWRTVLPLQDGRECPECFAVVIGGNARIAHRNWHEEQRNWQYSMVDSAREIATKAGLSTAEQRMEAPALRTMNTHPDTDYDPEEDENDD